MSEETSEKKPKKDPNIVGMTFNMPRDWHTRFKLTAVSQGIDMKELLVRSFAAYERELKAGKR